MYGEAGAGVGVVVVVELCDHGHVDDVVDWLLLRPGIAMEAGSATAVAALNPAAQYSAVKVVSQSLRMAGPP
jgi:orotidine-5'-phosphate decarboxylase